MEAAAKCFAFLSLGFNDIEWPGRLTLKSKKQDKYKMMDVTRNVTFSIKDNKGRSL